MEFTKGEWKNIKMTNGTNRVLVDGGTQSTSDDEQICEYITNEANAHLIAKSPRMAEWIAKVAKQGFVVFPEDKKKANEILKEINNASN